MKCPKCGFISNKDFFRCPYCGRVNEEDREGIRTRVNIGKDFSIQIRTILILLVANLFFASILVDWYFDFAYSISLWSFFFLFGSLIVVDAATSKKKNFIIALQKVFLYLLVFLLLSCGLFQIKGIFDFRMYFPTIILPAYLIISMVVSTVIFFGRKNARVRPIFTELLFALYLTVAIILFVFFLVNKYCIANGVSNPPFAFMQLDMVDGNRTTLYTISEVLIFASFGLSLITLTNFNIILIGFIYRKVKKIYGGERD